MGRYADRVWPGNPSGATRAERASCRFRAYVPDPLVGADLELPGSVAADLVDVEQAVRNLSSSHPGLANLEPLARFLLRAEAVASSNIEGLVLNVRRLARNEAAEREGWDLNDAVARALLRSRPLRNDLHVTDGVGSHHEQQHDRVGCARYQFQVETDRIEQSRKVRQLNSARAMLHLMDESHANVCEVREILLAQAQGPPTSADHCAPRWSGVCA